MTGRGRLDIEAFIFMNVAFVMDDSECVREGQFVFFIDGISV